MSWPDAAWWPGLFTEYLIKTTLALSICLLGVWVSRRRTAALRHFLLSFFLIGLLLLPVLSTVRFGWETDLLPARARVTDNRKAPGSLLLTPIETLRAGGHAATSGGLITTAESRSGGTMAGPMNSSSHAPVAGRIASMFLPFLWSAGLAFLLLKLSLGIVGAYRLTREGIDVTDPAWRRLLARFLAKIRITRAIRLKSHGGIAVPITWGFFKPVVLLPRRHEEWTEDQRSSALLHELCHIKRADFLVMFLVRLSLAVFWFNPLSWIVFRRLKQEQEHACDELVMTAGIKPSTYAATLLYFRSGAAYHHNLSTAFLGLIGNGSFNERLAAILRQKLTLKEVTMKTRIMLAAAVILAVSLIGMARPPMAFTEGYPNPFIPAPAALQVDVLPVQESARNAAGSDQDKKIEVTKEQDKKKEEQKGKIVITDKAGKKLPIDVTIVIDGTARKIRVDNPLTIKKGEKGELILLGPDGKEVEVLLGEPLQLTINGKDLTLVKEGDVIRIDQGALHLVYDKDKEGLVKVQVAPRVRVVQSGTGSDKAIRVSIERGATDAKTIRTIVSKKLAVDANAKQRILVKNLTQAKVKQAVIAEVIRAIKKSGVEPVKLEARRLVGVRVGGKPITFTLFKPEGIIEAGSEIWIMKDPPRNLMAIRPGNGAHASIMFEISPGENSRETYDRIVARVKQELPEGYAIEPEFNEKSGTITLRVTASGTQIVSSELINKLADLIKAEIK